MDDIAGRSVILWDLVVHLTEVSTVLVYFINIFPGKFILLTTVKLYTEDFWVANTRKKDLACGISLTFDRNVNFCQDHEILA